MSDQPPKPFQFSLRKLLLFVAALCIVLALVFPAIRAAREAKRRQTCQINLKFIGLALQEYYDTYGYFPAPFSVDAEGKPLHSWRVAIFWFLNSSNFAVTFDYTLPWDDPKNLKVSTPFANQFRCPGAGQGTGSGSTNYVMVVGQKRNAGSGKTLDRPDAIIVVEIADSDIHWTEPRDLNFDEMSFQINDRSKPSISSHHRHHSAMVLYADGSAHTLGESFDPVELKKLLTENLDDASGISRRSHYP